ALQLPYVRQPPVGLVVSRVTGVTTIVAVHRAVGIEARHIAECLGRAPDIVRTVGVLQPDQPRQTIGNGTVTDFRPVADPVASDATAGAGIVCRTDIGKPRTGPCHAFLQRAVITAKEARGLSRPRYRRRRANASRRAVEHLNRDRLRSIAQLANAITRHGTIKRKSPVVIVRRRYGVPLPKDLRSLDCIVPLDDGKPVLHLGHLDLY